MGPARSSSDNPLFRRTGLDSEHGLVCRKWSSGLGMGKREQRRRKVPTGLHPVGPMKHTSGLPTAGTNEGTCPLA